MEYKGTILVMDDEPGILDIVGNFLNHMGYGMKGYENPVQAFEKEPNVNEFKKVVTDFNMPGMNGSAAVMHMIKNGYPVEDILAMSGEDYETALKELGKYGVKQILQKPFNLKDLKKAVEG